jgi:hypothetical protein
MKHWNPVKINLSLGENQPMIELQGVELRRQPNIKFAWHELDHRFVELQSDTTLNLSEVIELQITELTWTSSTIRQRDLAIPKC